MRIWQTGLAAAFWLAGPACSAKDSELPAWNEGERAGWEAAGMPLTGEARRSPAEPLDLAPPTAAEIAAGSAPSEPIPEKYWAAYFGERPKTFLVDPQGLLSPADYRDRLAFLQDHARDSVIDLFVYVFKGDQEIPGEVRAEELNERLFSNGRPAALVCYYLGAPQRSVLYLSPSLTDVVSASEQRRALESSVMQAIVKKDASGQIETFLVQMSIRIYSMEQLVGGGSVAGENSGSPVRKAKTARKKSATLEKLQPILERARPFAMPAAVAAAVLLAGWLVVVVVNRRRRYRFPVLEVEPRLGGVHGAGVGTVISFASASVSPASQRDQLPDRSRRG